MTPSYRWPPILAGKPGWRVLSPGKPLAVAPVPITPGVDTFGTPGWLTPLVLFPDGMGAIKVGGVAGDTPGVPTGPVTWARVAVDAISDAANTIEQSILYRMGGS